MAAKSKPVDEAKGSKVPKKAKKRKSVKNGSHTDIRGSREETSEALAYFARYFDQI